MASPLECASNEIVTSYQAPVPTESLHSVVNVNVTAASIVLPNFHFPT